MLLISCCVVYDICCTATLLWNDLKCPIVNGSDISNKYCMYLHMGGPSKLYCDVVGIMLLGIWRMPGMKDIL